MNDPLVYFSSLFGLLCLESLDTSLKQSTKSKLSKKLDYCNYTTNSLDLHSKTYPSTALYKKSNSWKDIVYFFSETNWNFS